MFISCHSSVPLLPSPSLSEPTDRRFGYVSSRLHFPVTIQRSKFSPLFWGPLCALPIACKLPVLDPPLSVVFLTTACTPGNQIPFLSLSIFLCIAELPGEYFSTPCLLGPCRTETLRPRIPYNGVGIPLFTVAFPPPAFHIATRGCFSSFFRTCIPFLRGAETPSSPSLPFSLLLIWEAANKSLVLFDRDSSSSPNFLIFYIPLAEDLALASLPQRPFFLVNVLSSSSLPRSTIISSPSWFFFS